MHPEIIAALQALAAKIFEHHPTVTNFGVSWNPSYGQVTITVPQGAAALTVSYGEPIEKPQ